jgi:hypothetical protein
MAWPSPVVPGNPIFASQFNGLLTAFSSWADSVNAVLTVGGGASTFNGNVTFAGSASFAGSVNFAGATFTGASTFTGAVAFAVAPTFTDPATTRTNLGVPSLSSSNTFSNAAGILQTFSAPGTGNTVFAGIYCQNDIPAFCSLRCYNSLATTTLAGITLANWSVLYCNAGAGLLIETANAAPIVFGTSNTERARFLSNGRLLLGTTTDDGSNLLQINGGVNFKDAINITLGSNWQNWTPTVTGSGSMTISALTINEAQYLRLGPLVFFKFYITFTMGGTIAASDAPSVSLPVTVQGNVSTAAMQLHPPSANWAPGYCLINSTGSVVRCALYNEAAMGAGSWSIICEGFYRAV